MNTPRTEENCLAVTGSPLQNNPRRGEGNGRPKKIMVVESELLATVNIKEDLLQSGYEVLASVTNGEDAIRAATEAPPDLILMDIVLDGPMGGIEAAIAIRKTHPIPIIYLTAEADAETVESSKATEPFGYLTKPCSLSTIIGMIEVALSKNKIDTEAQARARGSFKDALLTKVTQVEELNIALKVLQEQRGLERREIEQKIQTNLTKLVMPSLQALENSKLTESQRIQVESIRINLQLLAETQVSLSGGCLSRLSSTEMQVANYVKAGKSTKEIAQFLNIASSTINTHRDSIRKKLGIKNIKINLKKELQKIL